MVAKAAVAFVEAATRSVKAAFRFRAAAFSARFIVFEERTPASRLLGAASAADLGGLG